LLLAGVAFPLWLCAAFVADNLFNLSPHVRGTIAVTFLVGTLAGLIRLYLHYWHKPVDAHKTAVYLEQRYEIGDNSLINAVHFDHDPSIPDKFKAMFDSAAESRCEQMDFRRVWQHARLQPAVKAFAIALLVCLAYVIPFPSHAVNALHRYLNPVTAVTPLNFTQFEITPGDQELIEGSHCLVTATATKFDAPVTDLDILVKDSADPLLYNMVPGQDGFAFELRHITRNTKYAVKNGNDQSRWYRIRVVERPRLDKAVVNVTPPAYTGAKMWQVDRRRQQANILSGSKVSIHTHPVEDYTILFYRDRKKLAGDHPDLAFTMSADTEVAVDVRDGKGFVHPRIWQCRFAVTHDRPPEVRFLNKELNREVCIGEKVPLLIEAGDDFGLTALEVFTARDEGETVLKRIHYRDTRSTRKEATVLSVSEDVFVRNAKYRIWARAYDNQRPPQSGLVLTPLVLHVMDTAKDMIEGKADDPYVQMFAALATALERQKTVRNWLSGRIERLSNQTSVAVLQKRQQGIHVQIVLASTKASLLYQNKRIKEALLQSIVSLQADLSHPLMKSISELTRLTGDPKQAGLNDVVLKQSDIVVALQQILGAVNYEKGLEDMEQAQREEEEQDLKLLEKLQKLKEDLTEFREEQRKILDDTDGIDKKEPEDWTEREEELLGDLAAKEQNFAKFFRAAFNDLSKLESQDFSNATMADELVEMIEELQKAGAALEKKHREIATVAEELAGQQAESIEANLERWLADAKDFIKWNGEEDENSPDVPLQDLPEELTDIVGELIDDLDDMEDVEDSTGSSLNAFDDGIGWGVSDGNMDNMSAKGITGNVMPNNNEVGGRSGEGRSGKSSGQFVEKEATGKGGRDTPTRLVQSPFEKGTVKDTSKDPQGGATGGGKQSGLGGEGLRGITPDQKPDVEQRLPGKQAELKQKAEALLRELNVRNLPTGDLEEAVNKMELIQRYSAEGRGLQVKQIRNELVSTLRDAKTAIGLGISGGTENSRKVTKRISSIRHHSSEPTPQGYEESVDAYFRALAREVEY
jgi:hypothetical protein